MVTLASRSIPLSRADFFRSELGPWTGEAPGQASLEKPGSLPAAPIGLCLRAVDPAALEALGPAGTRRLPLSPKLTVLFSS